MAASTSRFRAVLRIALAGFAAFAVYFCMYGFRKPFAVASHTTTRDGLVDY